ncbi:NAD(+) hydrolase sarm1-like isoform X3 [Amphibalanus amphitrite]|uniref:NAD(+) hydrolase sarm1-like isoform X3 n=1 Tax=Amphibalanus amphitrite TaxID=1232801 RepID=UPI001C91458A|nr:NAD(+) hydrolase sarm1-like isoform X3 [Amphibalanus amphitrite]
MWVAWLARLLRAILDMVERWWVGVQHAWVERTRLTWIVLDSRTCALMTMTDVEPEITQPETPTPPNGLSTTDGKLGPLAKLGHLTSAADTLSANTQISSANAANASARIAKRSNMVARATAASTSELTAQLGGQLTQALTTQSEQQNFNRKVSQSSIANGAISDASRLAATTTKAVVAPVTTALEAQAQAVKALQSKASATSMAISADARQLADSFDSLKKLSDRLPDSLSMEKLNDRDLLNINLTSGDNAPRDPNVKVFEHNQTFSSSNKKLVTNDFSTEEATANREETTHLQEGDNSYSEKQASSDMRAKLEINGITAEKGLSTRQEERHIATGDVTHDESRSAAVAGAKISTGGFSAEKVSMADDQQSQTVTSVGVVNKEQRSTAATRSRITISKQQGVTTPTSPAVAQAVEELECLERSTDPLEAARVLNRCSQQVSQMLRGVKAFSASQPQQKASVIDQMDAVMTRAWTVPSYGQELGNSLCNVIRDSGGLDVLISSVNTGVKEMDLKSARVLGQCLTTENRRYVVERGLDSVVQTACRTCSEKSDNEESRVGSNLLENLFRHSEDTCSAVVRMGGLDAVITQCKNKDVETLRHCASALANLALYGGPENQQAMMKREVPTWLFPLAFHNDDNIKYYACLAITSMVANKQLEAAVLKSGTLGLVDPFVTSHDPSEFSKSAVSQLKGQGQSKNWLRRLVPVLFSKREEARKLAAFHFCMEAGVKVQQGCPEIFDEIGAIEPLKQVASSPNAVASKYAAQALRTLGKEVPHKLSQQVPLWSVQDVKEWVKQIDYASFSDAFEESRVDGDLLLRMSENMLTNDIGISNSILCKRFMRELNNLKKMADYASCDSTKLNDFLREINPEFSTYTYPMLSAGVDRDYLRYITDDQLLHECSIANSIHRKQIQQAILNESAPPETEGDMSKTLDCFISYRRSNGSQLASLLKVHLNLRGFSVFIDVERLEAGKFDNNLLNSIRQAKNFILVLTPSALDRCIQDYDQKDWVHKEVCAALQSKCNIIPIIDNFQWPEAEELPEDMRSIVTFNGVSWIHDYQDACVDKLERFIRGEVDRPDGRGLRSPRPLRHSPLLSGLQHPSRPGSRCQSPARLTPAPSPLPRRPRRYQNRLDVTAAAMARSRSVDAILDSDRRGRRPPARGESEESYQGSGGGSPAQSREGTPPSVTDGLSSEDGLDEVDLPSMNGRSSGEESEEGRRLPRAAPQEEESPPRRLSQRRSTSLASHEDVLRAELTDRRASEDSPRLVEAVGPAAKPANGLRLSVPAAGGAQQRPAQPRTLPRSTRLGRSRQPPKLTLSAPSPDSPKSLPSSSPSLSTGSGRAPSTGSRGSRSSDIFRQNRLRKSNLVERAFDKVRSKITKENK